MHVDDPILGQPKGLTKYRGVAGICQQLIEDGIPRYCFPAISAFICAYGRETMRSLRNLCPPHTVWYQATDSLLCSREAVIALADSGVINRRRLGSLKCEGTYPDGEIIGVNNLRRGTKIIATGRYARAVRGPDGKLRAELWEDVASALKSEPDATVTVQQLPLSDRKSHAKGDIGPNGWTTPFRLTLERQEQICRDWRDA